MTRPAADVPWLAHDARRNVLALVLAAPCAAAALGVYAALVPVRFTADTIALTAFVFWIAYSIGWLVLTHAVFGGIDHAELTRRLGATMPAIGRMPTANVQWSLLAAGAVALVLILPGLLHDPLANALSVVVVVSAWVVTVSAYAVHYARLHTVEKSIDIPGPGEPVFVDYYYLAAQIATTFSSSDITILTSRARAVVTGQTFISFAFSTFIIALLITVVFL